MRKRRLILVIAAIHRRSAARVSMAHSSPTENRSFADPMSEALKIRARRARCIDVKHKLCPLIEELRLAVGRLHDYSIEAAGVLPMSQEERAVIQAHSALVTTRTKFADFSTAVLPAFHSPPCDSL